MTNTYTQAFTHKLKYIHTFTFTYVYKCLCKTVCVCHYLYHCVDFCVWLWLCVFVRLCNCSYFCVGVNMRTRLCTYLCLTANECMFCFWMNPFFLFSPFFYRWIFLHITFHVIRHRIKPYIKVNKKQINSLLRS